MNAAPNQSRETTKNLEFASLPEPYEFWNPDCTAFRHEGIVRISNRRMFLWTVASLGGVAAASPPKQTETVYHFLTPECEGQMSVQFFNKYSSTGFWFDDRDTNRKFCLSATGREGHDCLPKFTGSIAVARYRLRPHPHSPGLLKLREHVRTIDQDNRMHPRPPFEGTLALQEEGVSDIQAFGYNPDAPATTPSSVAKELEPWCLLRQDLYLDEHTSPFLIVHWKHTLNAITLIDVIPGDQTQLVKA